MATLPDCLYKVNAFFKIHVHGQLLWKKGHIVSYNNFHFLVQVKLHFLSLTGSCLQVNWIFYVFLSFWDSGVILHMHQR